MIAPLENNASYVAASETLREKRHRLRRTSGYLLNGERVNSCGRKRHSQTVDIHRTAKQIAEVPFIELPRQSVPKDRYLTREEAERLWNAAESAHLKLFIHLALVTGARKGAILDLTWDRVDLVNRRLDFNNPNKPITNKRRPRSPITPETVKLLEDAKQYAESDHVIEYNGKPLADIKKSFKRAALKAGLHDVTAHTLKHTAISWLAQSGFSPEKISALTETRPETVRRHYQKFNSAHLEEEAGCLSEMASFSNQFAKPTSTRAKGKKKNDE